MSQRFFETQLFSWRKFHQKMRLLLFFLCCYWLFILFLLSLNFKPKRLLFFNNGSKRNPLFWFSIISVEIVVILAFNILTFNDSSKKCNITFYILFSINWLNGSQRKSTTFGHAILVNWYKISIIRNCFYWWFIVWKWLGIFSH